MGGDAESAKPPHIVGHVTSLPREGVRRLREPRRGIMPVGRADFDAIDHQHAGSIHRSQRRPRTISVVGENDEGQLRAGGGPCYLLDRSRSIGSAGVYVEGAGDDRPRWHPGWRRSGSGSRRQRNRRGARDPECRRRKHDRRTGHRSGAITRSRRRPWPAARDPPSRDREHPPLHRPGLVRNVR